MLNIKPRVTSWAGQPSDRWPGSIPATSAKVNQRTRAIYLVNLHNPTGTVNDVEEFKGFLRKSSQNAVAIVDEAYGIYCGV